MSFDIENDTMVKKRAQGRERISTSPRGSSARSYNKNTTRQRKKTSGLMGEEEREQQQAKHRPNSPNNNKNTPHTPLFERSIVSLRTEAIAKCEVARYRNMKTEVPQANTLVAMRPLPSSAERENTAASIATFIDIYTPVSHLNV